MNIPMNALGLSHFYTERVVKEGDICLDGTAGRGRDTLFLARLVGKTGRVIAFDIQKEAVESTRALLKDEGIDWADVHHACHSRLDAFVAPNSLAAAMFNFGWLPGGDHNVFSKPETSLIAIEKALTALKVGGLITLCLYYGKETGFKERDAILSWLKTLDQKQYSVLYQEYVNRKNCPPLCILITKDA